MTAVIGILNKNGITMAADSAVTVTGGNQKKIYNTANKIFTLSKYHPIGIMIYNSSTFMTTPWEIIIKLYRKNLEETYFSTVEDYKNDFVKFLKDKNFFTTEEAQKNNLFDFAYWNLDGLKNRIINNLSDGLPEEDLKNEFKEKILADLRQNIETYDESSIILDDFKDYTIENFKIYSNEILTEVINTVFEDIPLNEDIINSMSELYFLHLRTTNFIGIETGLVFGGFGEDEIYPSITSIRIAEVFDNRLRYFDYHSDKITDSNNGSIMPFAQTDVINMFIRGIDPEIDNTYLSIFKKLVEKYNTTIFDILKDNQPELAAKVADLDINAITKQFSDEINNVKREKQILPTVDTVSILSKEDLAEMAESLIYLTYLKRRISSSEESVGGPIDVAIISKGDGFIWKKRKHYFDNEINKQFMANYFKKY